MTASAKDTKKQKRPTLEDVSSGRVSLDNFEAAHGEGHPEWTDEDFARAQPTREMFPNVVKGFERLRGQRGPQKKPTKERIGLRLDPEVIAHFRAAGPGWQSRINDVLVEHIKSGRNR